MNLRRPTIRGLHIEFGLVLYARNRPGWSVRRWLFWAGRDVTILDPDGSEWQEWASLVVCGFRITLVAWKELS